MDDISYFDQTAPAPLPDYYATPSPGPLLVPNGTLALLEPQGLDPWCSALARTEASLDALPTTLLPDAPPPLTLADPLLLAAALCEAPQLRKRGRPRKADKAARNSQSSSTSVGTSSASDSPPGSGYGVSPMPGRQKRNRLAAARSRTRASVEIAQLTMLEQASTRTRQQLMQQKNELEAEVLTLRCALQEHLAWDLVAAAPSGYYDLPGSDMPEENRNKGEMAMAHCQPLLSNMPCVVDNQAETGRSYTGLFPEYSAPIVDSLYNYPLGGEGSCYEG